MGKRSRSSLGSTPITCWSVMHWALTPRGMPCPQGKKTTGTFRPLEHGYKRVVHGIDGVLLLVVIGDGKLVVPVDFAVRRPDLKGPGAPCRTKLSWAQGMLDA